MPEFVTPDVWVKGGLLEGKHINAMGEAVWLYMYFQSRVRRTGEHAGTLPPGLLYQHRDAVEALGVPRRRVERWFAALTATDAPYIVATRRRLGYEIAITKYEDLRERANQRRSRPAETGASSEVEIRQNEHSDTPNSVRRYANSGSRPAETGASSEAYIKEAHAVKQLNRLTEQQGETRAHAREAAHTPESIRLYCHLRQTSLSQTQANAIRATVAEDPESLATWRRAVEACEANGIGKGNVKCALDWHAKGIPEKYRLPGTPGSPGANGQLAARHPAPERPQLTAKQEAASDAARERARAEMTDRGLIGKYAQIGRLPT